MAKLVYEPLLLTRVIMRWLDSRGVSCHLPFNVRVFSDTICVGDEPVYEEIGEGAYGWVRVVVYDGVRFPQWVHSSGPVTVIRPIEVVGHSRVSDSDRLDPCDPGFFLKLGVALGL